MSKQSRDVKVLSTEVVQDENGTAAVVRIRNTGKTALAQIPVSIDVRGSGAGKSLFRNDDPGLEPSLVRACCARARSSNGSTTRSRRRRSPVPKAKVGEAKSVRSGPKVTVTRRGWNKTPSAGWQRSGSPRTARRWSSASS